MWQWTAALTADAAIDSGGAIVSHWHLCRQRWQRRGAVISNGDGGRAGEDGGESSEIFDNRVESVSTIP